MGRNRSLKSDFFRSESLARCSRDARITFAGLWSEADDFGRGIANPRLLKGALWALDDDITPKDIEEHLQDLSKEHIVLYEIDGKRYFAVLNWQKHQAAAYRRGEAVHPEPPAHSTNANECKEVQAVDVGMQESAVSGREVEGKVEVDSSEADASADAKPRRPHSESAAQLLRDWVEAETPHRRLTPSSWPGKVAAIRGFLVNGWVLDDLRPIVLRCAVISTDAIQLEIGRTRRPSGRDPDANRKTINRVIDQMAGAVSTANQLESGME